MYKSKFACKLFVGRPGSKNRKVCYVSSAEYTDNSIVIHLSDDESFVDSPLCFAVSRVLECCENKPRRLVISTEEVLVPSSDSYVNDALHFIQEYKRVYGSKSLADLVSRSLHCLSDQEVTTDEA